MTDSQYFFITGPPRSGTTWLANLLTDHDTICFHESLRETGTIGETVEHLKAQGRKFVGDCGPFVGQYSQALTKEFPLARWITLSPVNSESTDTEQTIHISSKAQFREPTAKRIWEHCCPGLPWDSARFGILSQMRVTTLEERAFQMMNPNIKRLVTDTTPNLTPLELEYLEMLKQICGTNLEAFEWLRQWCNALLTWDHIVDGDPIDAQMADDVFQDMILKWPYNNFWKQYGALMVPTLSNVINAWHYSNETGDNKYAYRVYTDTALTIAYILGGRAWRDRWSTKIRELVEQIRIQDDTKDGDLP